MTRRSQMGLMPGGRRLHLQDGPIDLVIGAEGDGRAVAHAYEAAAAAFTGLLDALCRELPMLRAAAMPGGGRLAGPVARRMEAAVESFAAETFITPMAAVAGAVAETVLEAMLGAADLGRAYVNNGGDIALRCAPGRRFTVGLVDRPDRPSLFGRVEIDGGDGVGGIATSGWRGRSFSLGIADSVTILARTAAQADAAATVVANSVDLPGHPGVRRVPADAIQPDTDLGPRLVTRDVGPLGVPDIARALDAGMVRANALIRRGLILGAALHLQGAVRVAGGPERFALRGPAAIEGNGHRRPVPAMALTTLTELARHA